MQHNIGRPSKVEEKEEEEKAETKPVSRHVFVSTDKVNRAQEILRLVNGEQAAPDEALMERKDRWTKFCTEAKVDPKSPEAVEFVYRKLGGLVREPEEHSQIEAENHANASKKRMVEADK